MTTFFFNPILFDTRLVCFFNQKFVLLLLVVIDVALSIGPATRRENNQKSSNQQNLYSALILLK
jgi:hypothetical protein